MKTVSLSGSPRENVGKKDAKRLRKQGMVPCVAYGGKEQVHFYLDERDFLKLLFTPESNIIKIIIGDNKEIDTLLQDVQYHPVSDKVLHADFIEFSTDKPVKTSIPVNAIGTAPGVLKGGSMKVLMRRLAVMAIVTDIPNYIEVDISKMEIGDTVMVKDLKLDNVEFLDPPNNVVVSVKVTRIAVEEEEEEDEEGEEGEEGVEGAEGAEGGAEGGDKPAEDGDKPA